MIITKTAEKQNSFRRQFLEFDSARDAFSAFLTERATDVERRVLLPAFIGWSPREGSGVFDPVSSSGLNFEFYQVDARLHVDVADFASRLRPTDVVVLIHYFGYVDPAYDELIRLARSAGALILEDEAHAMFTDLALGGSGRAGDAAILSLHKMLPFSSGGMLVWNVNNSPAVVPDRQRVHDIWSYDLLAIAEHRRANAGHLHTRLSNENRWFEPLWPAPGSREVPQTYPILVRHVSRFAIYERLQAEGFGVVALYHTLIPEIDAENYPDAHRIAETILNLPVHQDVDILQLDAMLDAMHRIAAELENE